MGDLVHIRLDAKMRKEIKQAVKDTMFSSESEFIRDAIRRNIENYKKIRILESFRNTVPQRNSKAKIPSDIFREFGLE